LGQLLDRLSSGAEVYFQNPAIGKATTFYSLPASYAMAPGAQFLKSTGLLHRKDTFKGCLEKTCTKLQTVLEGMRTKDGYGLWSMFKLAETHKGYNDRAQNGAYGDEWKQNSDPVISMEGMLWTELTFSVVALEHASEYTQRWSGLSDDLDAYTVLWSVLGNVMGVQYELASFADAKELFKKLASGPDMIDRLPEGHSWRKAMNELLETFHQALGWKSTLESIFGKIGVYGLFG
jgi:hypothetical protein